MKTYIAIVLDASGSMASCLNATISGFNEQVQEIKSKASLGGETFVSLWTFNSSLFEHFVNKDPNFIHEITDKDYCPSGGTALRDAVGSAICRLATEDDKDSAFLVMIMSDGEENSSKEFSVKALADLITEKKNTGRWTFTYMGSNQDLTKVAKEMNLDYGNMINYTSTKEGTARGMIRSRKAIGTYMADRAFGFSNSCSLYSADNSIAHVDDAVNLNQTANIGNIVGDNNTLEITQKTAKEVS